MMSSKINPVIQSFQVNWDYLKVWKHTGIGSWAEVVTLLLVHSPAGEFIWCPDPFYDIWPTLALGAGIVSPRTMCYQCYPGHYGDTRERVEREREVGNGKCQWDNCVTTLSSARPSDSWQTRPEVTSEEFKFIHTSYLQPRLQEVLHSHLFSQVKFNFTWDVSRHVEMWVTGHCFQVLTCHRGPELTRSGLDTDNMIYEGVYTEQRSGQNGKWHWDTERDTRNTEQLEGITNYGSQTRCTAQIMTLMWC